MTAGGYRDTADKRLKVASFQAANVMHTRLSPRLAMFCHANFCPPARNCPRSKLAANIAKYCPSPSANFVLGQLHDSFLRV